jgi:hypothetical protein
MPRQRKQVDNDSTKKNFDRHSDRTKYNTREATFECLGFHVSITDGTNCCKNHKNASYDTVQTPIGHIAFKQKDGKTSSNACHSKEPY